MGPEFVRSEATVDKKLILHTANNDAVLMRPLDGTILQRHQGSRVEKAIWFGGTRRLSYRREGNDQQILEMRDFDGDSIVWQLQHPEGSLMSVIDSNEVAVLEPSGTFSIFELTTGKPRVSSELPVKRPLGSSGELAVQKSDDRYVVVAGVASKNSDELRVLPFASDTAFTVDGYVCAVERSDGRVVWSVSVENLAFDYSQPANIPVLVLASQKRTAKFYTPRLSVLILDRRTGETVFQKEDQLTQSPRDNGRGAQFIPMIQDHQDRTLVIALQTWQVELTIPNDQK